MLSVLIEGTLTAEPVRRTSAAGKPYITASIRAGSEGGESVLCSCIAFDVNVADKLAALSAGDPVAVAGHAGLSQWQGRDGEHRTGLKVTVTRAMSLYDAGKRRSAAGNDRGG